MKWTSAFSLWKLEIGNVEYYSWKICNFLLDYEEEEDTENSSGQKKKLWRHRWSEEIHDDVLARLLDLNQQRTEMHDDQDEKKTEALRQKVRNTVKDLLDLWERIANDKIRLQYQREVGEAPLLIYEPLDPELQNQPLEV